MIDNSLFTHVTETHRVSNGKGSGWEFVCRNCGYHVRYWDQKRSGQQNLEIVNIGNPDARHTSSSPMDSTCEWETDPLMEGSDGFPDEPVAASKEESWLTPELRMQLEDIVKGFDEDLPEGPL